MNEQREDNYTLCTWDCDASSRITAAAAFNFCQETAGKHAQDLGVGIDFMNGHGIAWILSRMSLAVDRRPLWGDRILVRTWPRGTERLFARRDYELADESGAVFARGRSAWLIVDVAAHRPRRPESFTEGLPRNDGRDALPDGIRGLDARSDLSPAGSRVAAYSDLDYNGHVNNARYIQWIQDALDAEVLAASSGFRVDINYLSEVTPGASVQLLRGSSAGPEGLIGNGFYAVEGRMEEGGAASFRAEIRIG